MARFHDLNIPYMSDSKKSKQSLKKLIELGYEVVAVNHVVSSLEKKDSVKVVPSHIELDEESLAPLKVRAKKFQQLSRLTVTLRDTQTYRLGSGPVQSYDILAVQPTSEKAFQLACTQLEIDIISLDMAERLPFNIKMHPVKAAIERGVHFEITYAAAIRDSTARRNIISNALRLQFMCKGKNIILSSDAENAMELRGPYDIANLGFLFGLNEAQSKDAVSMNCRSVLLHAETRRNTAKAALSVTKVMDVAEKHMWKVRENRAALPNIGNQDEDSDTSSDDSDDDDNAHVRKKRRKLQT
ncbi:ribonuclease P protein subunit p30-like [Glandiceps talaboti]